MNCCYLLLLAYLLASFFFSYTFLNQSVPVGAALEADSYASVDGAVCSIPELDILDILFRALLVKYAARSRLTH